VKVENIDTRNIDIGVGVLRGTIAKLKLPPRDAQQVEAAIVHIRGAARLVERIQLQIWKTRSEGQRRRRRRR
jgi:hypothetical protein